MTFPYLYFRKTHKETQISFDDRFSGKNLPQWNQTPLCELETLARARIDYWNSVVSNWQYEILGWRVE